MPETGTKIMKKIQLTLLFFALFVTKANILSAQPQTYNKVIFASGSNGSVHTYALLQTPYGNLLPGITNNKPCALMVNDAGNILWCKTYDLSNIRFVCAVNTNDSAILLAGSNPYGTGGVILVKITSNGDTLWSKKLVIGNADFPLSVQTTNDGNYILSGTSERNDSSRMFLAKLSSSGNLIWGRIIYSYKYFNCAFSAFQIPDQGYLVAGYTGGNSYNSPTYMTLIKLTSNGSLSWAKQFSGSTKAYDLLSSDGFYFSLGISPWGIMMIKFDTAGTPFWGKFYTGWTNTYQHRPGPRLRRCADGDFAFTMGYEEDYFGNWGDMYRTDPNGDLLFSRTLHFYVEDLIPKSDSGLLISGNGPLAGVNDQVYTPQTGLIKMDAQGDPGYCDYPKQYTSSTFSPALTNYTPIIKTEGAVSSLSCTVTTVNLIDFDGCVSIYPGIEDQKFQDNVEVFPNPSSGEITIGKTISQPMLLSQIEIHNLTGNLISCIENPKNEKLDLGFLQNGMYILTAYDGLHRYSLKLIISHNK